MAKKPQLRRYVIMASEGFQNAVLTKPEYQPSSGVVALTARPMALRANSNPQMRVLDTIQDNGPKLVEMPAESELSLRLSDPGLKIVPEVFYHRQWTRFKVHKRPAKKMTAKKATAAKGVKKMAANTVAAASAFTVTITDAVDGKAVPDVLIVAFTNFDAREGAQGRTDANGRLRLNIAPSRKLERVYVYSPAGYWGNFFTETTGTKLATIKLARIQVTDPNLLLTLLYKSLPMTGGAGVTVAIIDSGVDATHPDLPNVSGGLNCVGDEVRANPTAAANFRPALHDGEHGTHVAGIVAGRGTASGFRGVAPGATLRAYRVFPDVGGGASNFDIAKAIDTAVADRCDIINMSLGGGPQDPLTQAAINRALAAGTLVLAAAGNDGREPVAFPAAQAECVAVSAMGRVGSFPTQAIGTSEVMAPRGNPSTKDFIAAFSNVGTEIDVVGPGVEIVSTFPGTGHGTMSGTSMACPAVAGFAAHLLSADATVRQKVGTDRSRALKDLLFATCKSQGFGRDFEGFGLPLPP